MFSIKDKILIITGGNGLLGKEIINSLRDEGAIVISADINNYKNDNYNLYLDISNEDSVANALKYILSNYGRIDGWVNNAYPRTKDWGNKFENVPINSWRENIDMHLNGYFICCKLVLEQLKKQECGSLINMSSIYGILGPDFNVYEGTDMTMPVAYSAIKGGINSLTRYLASYFGPFQIRVNSISPGGIFDNQPDKFVQNYNKKVPMRRMGQPKDVIAAVHFLLSDESSYITGQNLIVDGGWSII
jgi:NAD(P)-dependent dehydrogenase (short-subunit alcohol dehydrogenase family)